MIKDRIAFDLPAYEGLLAGHFQRGQGYGRRRDGGTDDWLLIMTLSGEGRIGSAKGDLGARAGDLYLIAPGTTHDYGTARKTKEWEILWVHFHPPTGWLEFLHWPEIAPGIGRLNPPNRQEIEEAFREVIRQSVSTGRMRPAFGLNALEKLLLLCEAGRPGGPDLLDERIKAAIEFIHSHLGEPIRLGQLSRLCHLSESRFAHLFRKVVGLAPARYLLMQRLQRAQTLLGRTSMGVAEISAEVGMDPYYLSLRFKRETGLSPREYRAVHAASRARAGGYSAR
jgi:AraC family transcriptional regulator of arabinose operon